jgi:hypothetical protein
MKPLPAYDGPLPEVTDGDDWIHPLDAAALRDPIPDGEVLVIVMAGKDCADPDAIGQGLLDLLKARNRKAEAFIVRPDAKGWDKAFEEGLEAGSQPIVLITTSTERWSAKHLAPLLKAIDLRDHVIGLRPASLTGRLKRWIKTLPWRGLFALSMADPFSPCRMHRRSALDRLVPQSSSRFLEVELLAKATFLTQVIEEVEVPSLASSPVEGIWSDFLAVLKAPVFVRPKPPSPAENLESQREGSDGPGGEHGEGNQDDVTGQVGSFEHHGSQGVEELSEREGLDEPLSLGGKPLDREEEAGEDPHREHHEVHQTADGLGVLSPAGDQEADPGEGQGSDNLDHADHPEVTSDRHPEPKDSERKQDNDVGDQERQASEENGEEEVATGHRSGVEPLQELADPEVHDQKSHAPEPAPHGVLTDEAGDQEVDVA